MRLLFAEKPAGITTHTSLNESDLKKPWVDRNDGYLEFLQSRLNEPLFPIHRLDKETTGAIAFALDKESAEKARETFESRNVYKEYLFLTDRSKDGRGDRQTFETESFIERIGNEYVSKKTSAPNSKTKFRFIRTEGRFSLWSAEPETGKPHQIRLHAEQEGIPILGDAAHGGSPFPALCLHSYKIDLGHNKIELRFTSEPPLFYSELSLLQDSTLCRWLAAIDRRERVQRSLKTTPSSTFRWIHTEGDPLRVEQLGEVICLNWFRETEPNDHEWQSIRKLCELKHWGKWYLQLRGDRGRAPKDEKVVLSGEDLPQRWSASEHDLEFEFRRDSGLSPGLFLDQRVNRSFINKAAAQTDRALNLFCYTSGFSIAAAKGGTKQVVSVDVSKPFLEWSKRNFELNGLSLEGHEFRAMDAREYLAWAVKKQLVFDLVICDPPSFARGKKDVFRIEKDFDSLFNDCLAVVKPGTGILLFSTNYEGWSQDDLGTRVQNAIRTSGVRAKILSAPSPDLDFEMPRLLRNMKCVLVQKNG